MKETNSDVDTRNVVKNRELLYRMIISQLFYDGFQPIAATLAAAVHADPPCPPSDRLLNLMMVGLQHEPDRKDRLAASSGAEHLLGTTGFDLEYEMDASSLAPEPATYETAYVTSHKMACRAGAFSACGQLVATGSVDASIKILDVERMLAKSAPEEVDPGREQQGHPVIRTLYDHTDEITGLDFHPREQILVSASRDCCIKLFDITKASAKKAYKSITDAEQVLAVAFHPLGDHIIAASTHPVIRLYDVTTSQCFVCPVPSHHHTKQVNSIKFSPNGKYFASGSADGSVKLWDTVSNRCFNTFVNAHDGFEVCSVAFTRNSKYLLTSGLDSSIKLWELASSRCLIQYTGAGTTGKQEHIAQAVFNHTEDYVMFPDEATTSLCTWHSRSASRCQLMSLGHNGAVRYDHTDEITGLDFHPREQILVSASRDCCIKLFDITKASAKKAYKSITDAEQVLAVAFHPLGDHIIAASTHPVIRLYDVTTSQCFVCPVPSHHHTKQVNSIKFSPNGKYFASGSADGSVKLWDTVSNRCFNTFVNAHDGFEVCSVAFTRNSKYLLTSGLDSSIKLWELASSRCLIQYTGAGTTGKQEHIAQAVFNHTEDYVMFPDEATTSLCTWHSRSASRCQLMSLGHNGAVRFIVHSGTAPAFLTCSDDYRARFWYRRNTH